MNIEKITILKMLHEGRPTIPEIANVIKKANSTVHGLLQELVDIGYVSPPRKRGAARDYRITIKGLSYLKQNKYISE